MRSREAPEGGHFGALFGARKRPEIPDFGGGSPDFVLIRGGVGEKYIYQEGGKSGVPGGPPGYAIFPKSKRRDVQLYYYHYYYSIIIYIFYSLLF